MSVSVKQCTGDEKEHDHKPRVWIATAPMHNKNKHGASTPITQTMSRKRCKHTRSLHTNAHLVPSLVTQ